jgi:hypothetical protein
MKYKILIILIVVVVLFSLSVNSREGFTTGMYSEETRRRNEEKEKAAWAKLSPEEKASRLKMESGHVNESGEKLNNALTIFGIVIGSIFGVIIVFSAIGMTSQALVAAVRKRRAMRNPSNATSENTPPPGGPTRAIINANRLPEGEPPRRVVGRGLRVL